MLEELAGSIVFVGGNAETEIHDVYRIDLGSESPDPIRLTRASTAAEYLDPVLSPDGQWIAMRQFIPSEREVRVVVLPADGDSEPTIVVPQGATPAWSPDGQSIAFSHLDDEGHPGIWVITRDGEGWGSPQPLTDTGSSLVPEEYPRYSPDGTMIAFASHRDGNWDIWVMNADGSGLRNLTQDPSLEYGFDWAPDGRRIAFDRDVGGQPDIFVIDVEGGEARPIASEPYTEAGPCWSPDGRHIAFSSRPPDLPLDLWVMSVTGSERIRLTATPDFDAFCDWVRD